MLVRRYLLTFFLLLFFASFNLSSLPLFFPLSLFVSLFHRFLFLPSLAYLPSFLLCSDFKTLQGANSQGSKRGKLNTLTTGTNTYICLLVCPSVCLSVQSLTPEELKLIIDFLKTRLTKVTSQKVPYYLKIFILYFRALCMVK